MPDMLVKLLELPDAAPSLRRAGENQIQIRRAMTPDKYKVVEWVRQHSGPSAAGECDVCFSRVPVSCFLATRGAEIVGYACYNATFPDFFGPTKVLEECQGAGVGKALLIRALHAMRDEGYAYAIIGGVGPAPFYEKCVGATIIPDTDPGVYKDWLGGIGRAGH